NEIEVRDVDHAAFDHTGLENKQWIGFRVSRKSLRQGNGVHAVVSNGGWGLHRLRRDTLSRCPFRRDFCQSVLHHSILAVRRTNLLPQLGILGNVDSLELRNDKVLSFRQVLLQFFEFLLFFILRLHVFYSYFASSATRSRSIPGLIVDAIVTRF